MQATTEVTITPKMMAQAFWGMGSDEQIEFLHELAATIKADQDAGNSSAYSLGELQWCFMSQDLKKPENNVAREMLMSMAAFCYWHTL